MVALLGCREAECHDDEPGPSGLCRMIAAGIALALVSASCYAMAATLQHGAIRTVTPQTSLRWTQLRAVVANPRWLFGLLIQVSGGTLHVVALSLAPLVVVQPVNVLAIGLTVLFSGAAGRAMVQRGTVLAVLASTIGTGLFVVLAAHHASDTVVSIGAQSLLLLLAVPTITAVIMFAWRCRTAARSPVFATAAGMSFGVTSGLTRAIARAVREHGIAGIHVGTVVGIVATLLIAAWCLQQAYASGRPETAVACQTVADPLVGVLAGGAFFHELSHLDAFSLLGGLAGAALAAVGVVALARHNLRVAPASGVEGAEVVAGGAEPGLRQSRR
jgi:hypothetical protein